MGRETGAGSLAPQKCNRLVESGLGALSRHALAVAALGACFQASGAMAAGVSAGTLINNTATATYTSGTATGNVSSNTVSVRVDELLDVAVANQTTSPVVAGATSAVLAYTVTNTGNGPEAFNLTANPAVAGNDFDATVEKIAIDQNGNGIYEPGIDLDLPAGTPTPAIAADSSATVFVIVSLPQGATDGQASQVSLTAAAVTGAGTPGSTIAGAGAGGGDAVVGASGADDTALSSLQASLATITLSKAAAIVDQFGGDQPVPGATVTYSLTATATGSGQVQNLQISDIIPNGTTYEAASLKLDGGSLTDAVDGDVGNAGSSGIAVILPTVQGGTTRVVTFSVKIN